IDAVNIFYKNPVKPLIYKNAADGTFDFKAFDMTKHSRAFVKIQDGCDNFCSYCKIPYARGNNRSRDYESIVTEIENIVKNGFEEIIFTGINIGSYNYDNLNFSKFLYKIANHFNSVRFRVSSIEPQYINDEFYDVFKLPNICSFIHIPLQSGSDKILTLMERKYNKEEYFEKITNIRRIKNNPFLSTDLILGFPDENERDFNETLDFIKQIDFSYIHLFGFSPRKGTKAFFMTPKIPERVRDERIKILNEIVKVSNYNYRMIFIGKKIETIIERSKSNFYSGKSDNYIDLKIITDKKLQSKKRYQILFESINEKGENIGRLVD
ncbi:MAG TPA: MiaB/RimO family radical SAM methylthiotransferase, partial [Spirochaetota bacterium]|nr:MiaB/RimO family radical SAM methylthiotransferase [Spirochaetota bacterium]